MVCSNCNVELKEGCLFCSQCGKEVQMVPDYNEYDDDFLQAVIEEENRKMVTAAKEEKLAKKANKMKLYVGIVVVVLVLVVGIVAGCFIKNKIDNDHANSFTYQVEQAQKAYENKNYQDAIMFYTNAGYLNPTNLDVQIALLNLYLEINDEAALFVKAEDVFRMDSSNRTACEILIATYDKQGNFEEIFKLKDKVSAELLDLFEVYAVSAPIVSVTAGDYEEEITIEIKSENGYEILYTTDGSNPAEPSNAIVYKEPITLTDGDVLQLRVVCRNSKGIISEEFSGQYTVVIPAPEMPTVSPDGGDFGAETYVTITVPSGCKAYYTWDGTTPTKDSNLYKEPILVPEGNNVLSVILIDTKTGKSSPVYRGNFVYYLIYTE